MLEWDTDALWREHRRENLPQRSWWWEYAIGVEGAIYLIEERINSSVPLCEYVECVCLLSAVRLRLRRVYRQACELAMSEDLLHECQRRHVLHESQKTGVEKAKTTRQKRMEELRKKIAERPPKTSRPSGPKKAKTPRKPRTKPPVPAPDAKPLPGPSQEPPLPWYRRWF